MKRVLVAGVGNIFFGDDGFGVEVCRRLMDRPLPDGVRVADFGIRSLDLTWALLDGWDAAVVIDATRRGGKPGTLYLIEPQPGAPSAAVEAHSLDPARVFAFARSLGERLPCLRVVGCEPMNARFEPGLSPEVEAAIDPAVRMVESLAAELAHA